MLDHEDLTPWSLQERLMISLNDHWYLKDGWNAPDTIFDWPEQCKHSYTVFADLACLNVVEETPIGDYLCGLRKFHKGPCLSNIPGALKVVDAGYVL